MTEEEWLRDQIANGNAKLVTTPNLKYSQCYEVETVLADGTRTKVYVTVPVPPE